MIVDPDRADVGLNTEPRLALAVATICIICSAILLVVTQPVLASTWWVTALAVFGLGLGGVVVGVADFRATSRRLESRQRRL
jgi:hypothetical protein